MADSGAEKLIIDKTLTMKSPLCGIKITIDNKIIELAAPTLNELTELMNQVLPKIVWLDPWLH